MRPDDRKHTLDSSDRLQFLKFEDWLGNLAKPLQDEPWLVVYARHEDSHASYAIFCALLPNDPVLISREMADMDWGVSAGELGHPSFEVSGASIAYHPKRAGRRCLLAEPLVLLRSTPRSLGAESSIELTEEFRLYHDLYFEQSTGEFKRRDEKGSVEIAARLARSSHGPKLEVRTPLIRDYLAAKNAVLVILHHHWRWIEESESVELGETPPTHEDSDSLFHYRLTIRKVSHGPRGSSDAILYAKQLVRPFSEPHHPRYRELSGCPQDGNRVAFIAGRDAEGKHIEVTLDGDSDDSTVLCFRREVLRRYYDEPSRFTISEDFLSENGYCWRLKFWPLPSEVVGVSLKHLRLDLPYQERLHWKQYNIVPSDRFSSSDRQKENEAWRNEPEYVVGAFKDRLQCFRRLWHARKGWDLFRSLGAGDEYALNALHTPMVNDQKEFDDQILNLTRLLIESINDKEIDRAVESGENDKSIRKLELYLAKLSESIVVEPGSTEWCVKFLRDLRKLRNGVAHRKSSKDYGKALRRFDPRGTDLVCAFKNILTEAIVLLDHMMDFALNEKLDCRNGEAQLHD
jgi:hypothetical protein